MRSVIVFGVACVVVACGDRTPSLPVSKTLSPDGMRPTAISWSPDGKHIAWWQPRAESVPEYELWVGNADMSGATKLGVYNGNNLLPAMWSPDGTTLAASASNFGFSSLVTVPAAGGPIKQVLPQRHTYQLASRWNRDGDRLSFAEVTEGSTVRGAVVSISTGKVTPLVPGVKLPAFGTWSPDGSHIAYQVVDGSKSTVWVCDSAGGNKRQLTTEGFESFPGISMTDAWSPDGKEILYESRRTGTSDLWVAPIDGGKLRQLTHDVRNDQNGSWSSDGKWIAFTSDRGKQLDVWVVPSAGGQEQRVTDTPAEEGEIPHFRPGTLELTYVATTRAGGVWTRDVASGKETRLTPDSIRTSWFNTAPDGKSVNLVIERGGGIADLAVVPIAGGPIRTLISGGGSVQGPIWSPDGSKIAFSSDRAGIGDIWVIDASGGALRALTDWPGNEQTPVWSADSKSVLFYADREALIGDIWKVSASGGQPVRLTHDGIVNNFFARVGGGTYAATLFGKKGQLIAAVLDESGKVHTVYDATNSFPIVISPSGDSILVGIEGSDVQNPKMLFSTKGGKGRLVLSGGYAIPGPWAWRPDGKAVLYAFREHGADHLGLLDIATGKLTPWTTGPDDEGGAEWTSDGKTIVFDRSNNASRIYSADLSKITAPEKP